MDSPLSVFTMFKRKKSLSCDNIEALYDATDYDREQQPPKRKNSGTSYSLRKLRSKSRLLQSMDRAKSFSSEDLVNDVDWRLVQIKKQLATLRIQDVKIRERMGSLSNSIDDVASSSSLTVSATARKSSSSESATAPTDKLNYVPDEGNTKGRNDGIVILMNGTTVMNKSLRIFKETAV